ncbi:ComE operon protein 1 [subsurface metagenome]
MNQADRFYVFITVFLIIALVVGGVMLLTNRNKIQPVELVLSQAALPQRGGEVYIGGAVINPGIYSLREGETIQALLSDVGLESNADLNHIAIYIPEEGEEQSPQKVDINRAESWLLEALPGIGETRAQAIVDYRNENGEFKRIEDLLQVKGIGQGTFDKIKDYITVSD